MRWLKFFSFVFLIGGAWFVWQHAWRLPRIAPQATRLGLEKRANRLERPEGMAPIAFEAFVRACRNARVHPWRLGQTIGDHPRSVGYHKRDGNWRGVPFCAAVDIGTWDLSRAQISRLNQALWRQGLPRFTATDQNGGAANTSTRFTRFCR